MEATAKKLALPPPFEEALGRHEHEIMRFLLRVTRDRNDALDLFQETWLRAYRAYPKLDSEQGLRPWLYRIATNLCRNRARDNLRRSRVISNGDDRADREHHLASASDSASVARGGDGPEAVLHLRRAIAGLPHKQGQALVMRKFAGLEYEEIGAELKCSADSARASVYQALKKLKAIR
jgi:RNA polymerase sigma-70 factor, ECF subfamily